MGIRGEHSLNFRTCTWINFTIFFFFFLLFSPHVCRGWGPVLELNCGSTQGKKKQNYERYPPLSSQKIVKGSCETEDAGGVTFFLFVFLLFPFLLPPEVILLELHNRAQASNALFVGSSLCISHFMDHLPA